MVGSIAWRVVGGRILLAVAVVCAAIALWALLGDGVRVRAFGFRFSATTALRPACWALGLAAAGLWLDTSRRSLLAWAASSGPAISLLLAATAAAAVMLVGFTSGTKAAGGADVHGYVSQAYLWLNGNLRIREPLAEAAPWPLATATFAPLGYREGASGFIVPTYSLGIPLLMAALMAVFGVGAEYWLTPLCAGALVLLTYLLGKQLSGHVPAAAAAICVAASPLVLYMTCWLLGDLPAATFWLASIASAISKGRHAAWLAGALAGVAVLIRPNLVGLSIIPMLLSSIGRKGASRKQVVNAIVTFACACAPAVLFIAWLFNHLYDSPLRSGYGANADLFKAEYLGINLRNYPAWLFGAHGVLPFLFLLPAIMARSNEWYYRYRWLLSAFPVLVFLCYVFYAPFNDWWYTRFLLPALPVMYVLSSDGLWNLSRDRRWVGAAALTVIVVPSVGFELKESVRWGVTSPGEGEHKYLVVGEYVRRHLPRNAVVYSMQHSGNIRHYSGRLIIRWDLLDPHSLDQSAEFMRGQGYEPYIILEDWEIPLFQKRFSSQQTTGVTTLEPHVQPGTYDTYLYTLGLETTSGTVIRIPRLPD